MASNPTELEREIDEIRHDLDDVVDELNTRLVTARRRVSVRYTLRHHPVALALVVSGGLVLFGALSAWRRWRIRRLSCC